VPIGNQLSFINQTVNRQRNCDTGNIQKTVDAANRQTDAIKAIIEFGSLKDMPLTLRQTAAIRLEHPLDSLELITELHGGKISRSGVNHRLQRIVDYAEKMGYLK
jgi:DNA-binding protein WhiA